MSAPSLLASVLQHQFPEHYWRANGARILRSCAAHLGIFRREIGDPYSHVQSEASAIGFAAARALHTPSPGWLPAYLETARHLSKLAEELAKEPKP